jgi:glycerol-3-phosphate dehydrogenase
MKHATADVVILGGGVAGLWLLNRLCQAGFSALLFETNTLGGAQTHKAQGIIHGGMKYALQGVLTSEASAMADMPTIWRDCLGGRGEIDLSAVPVLSPQHYLWSPGRFRAKLAGLLASTALTSKVSALPKEQYPLAFRDPAFRGEIFALDELVVDVPALVRELAKNHQDRIYKIDPLTEGDLALDEQGQLAALTIKSANNVATVSAQQFVFTAGAGNELMIQKLKQPGLAMQKRPLHMVMVKTPFVYPVYAHCLGLGARPRITITTHYLPTGEAVWYLGGQLSEDGVGRDSATQIKFAKKELCELLPWLDFTHAVFATFMIDRAEPRQKNGLKPETAYIKQIENMSITWPTKLALAPRLAAEVLQQFTAGKLTPQFNDITGLHDWPKPSLATPVWEEAFCRNDA